MAEQQSTKTKAQIQSEIIQKVADKHAAILAVMAAEKAKVERYGVNDELISHGWKP